MSSATSKTLTTVSANRLGKLLQEYTKSLRDEMTFASEVHNRYLAAVQRGDAAERQTQKEVLIALQTRLASLRPALNRLDRTASQYVEHAKVNEIQKLEITIRIADLESVLELAMQHIRAMQPKG